MQQAPLRPVGLTVMAMLNIVFAAFAALTVSLIVLALQSRGDLSLLPTGIDPALVEKFAALPVWFLQVELGMSLAKCGLFVASAVGYLRQSRKLGVWGG